MGVATAVPSVLVCPMDVSIEDSTILGTEVASTDTTAVDVSPGIKLTETLSVERLELRGWDRVWLVVTSTDTSVELTVGTMAVEFVPLSVGVTVTN